MDYGSTTWQPPCENANCKIILIKNQTLKFWLLQSSSVSRASGQSPSQPPAPPAPRLRSIWGRRWGSRPARSWRVPAARRWRGWGEQQAQNQGLSGLPALLQRLQHVPEHVHALPPSPPPPTDPWRTPFGGWAPLPFDWPPPTAPVLRQSNIMSLPR